MLPLLFTIFITMQLLAIVLHDLLDIPGWTHGTQVRRAVGRRKFWVATPINAIFPAVAAGTAIYFLGRPEPAIVRSYWVFYCAMTVASAIAMWWMPYFFGAP